MNLRKKDDPAAVRVESRAYLALSVHDIGGGGEIPQSHRTADMESAGFVLLDNPLTDCSSSEMRALLSDRQGREALLRDVEQPGSGPRSNDARLVAERSARVRECLEADVLDFILKNNLYGRRG